MFIKKINDNIFRLLVPFEDLTTTVYVAMYNSGIAIIDSATYSSDVDNYIIPALKSVNIEFSKVKYLLLTHNHADHSGGINRLSEVFSSAIIASHFKSDLPNYVDLSDGEIILGGLQVVYLPGHTDTSIGFYDIKSKSLLSGDCLQLNGIGKYRNGVLNKDLYINSIQKLKKMNIDCIIAAHEYDPLGSVAQGNEAVNDYLDACIALVRD